METKHVIVVGAGVSGLTAAYELQEQNCRVTILEAQERVGGRVYTVREPFRDGQVSELGAGRIPSHHHLALHYIQKLNLPLTSFLPSGGLYTNYYKGTLITERSPRHTPLSNYGAGFNDIEQALDMRVLEGYYLQEPWKEAGDLRNPFAMAEAARVYDDLTLGELLIQQGASKEASDFVLFDMYERAFKDRVSALFAMRNLGLLQEMKGLYRIQGGNDRLPTALAAALKSKVQFGCRVTEIAREGAGVRVAYEEAGTQKTLDGDHVIVALPPTITRKLRYRPALPEVKMQALQAWIPLAPARVSIQFDRRFWRDAGLNGFVRTDIPCGIWDFSHNQAGDCGLLIFYIRSKETQDRLGAMSEQAVIDWACSYLEIVFPHASELRKHVVASSTLFWGKQEWSEGGYNILPKGKMFDVVGPTAQRVGPIHFAGAHTSAWCVWIQGAVDAALRVCAEITGKRPEIPEREVTP